MDITPRADEIFTACSSPVQCWPSKELLIVAVTALATCSDVQAVALIESLALMVIDREEELTALQSLLRAALTLLCERGGENRRFRERILDLVAEKKTSKARTTTTGSRNATTSQGGRSTQAYKKNQKTNSQGERQVKQEDQGQAHSQAQGQGHGTRWI